MTNYDAVSLLDHDYDGTTSDDYDAHDVLARLELREAGWL